MGTAPDTRAEPPLIAGRYQLGDLLGKGGAGAVYHAIDSADGRNLALKRLHASASATACALFEREYRTLAGLRHPNIVEVFEYGEDADGSFYTMELLHGADLSNVAPLSWKEVCACLRDIATTLTLLHTRRLLHRDLSAKNLWRLPDGRIKLLDFGALTGFGVPSEVAGTPPFVPPEALRGLPLDQRSDLYALGALGYWLLTSVHAFPARSFAELSRQWQHDPAPPSSLAAMVTDKTLEPVPAEIDALIASLLKRDANARPGSTTDLIDRLSSIAGLPVAPHAETPSAYLHCKAFVGRERERERSAELLKKAKQGHGQAIFVEAERGMGRTRLLEEIAVQARLSGALTLTAACTGQQTRYGVANALALRLLSTLPDLARRSAAPHQSVLGLFSSELRSALGVADIDLSTIARDEERGRVQLALHGWFSAVCREHFVVITIDDFDEIDEESQAFLAALALASSELRLLVVAASQRDASRALSAASQGLRHAATRFRLIPLTAAETHALLESLFGDVPYLARLADRLQRASLGVPARCVAMSERLVQSGVIQYTGGMWMLPVELSRDELLSVPRRSEQDVLELLTPDALQLAERMSAERLLLRSHLCVAVSGLSEERTFGLLDALVRAGIVSTLEGGFKIAREDLQKRLYARLDAQTRVRVHAVLGEAGRLATTALEQVSQGFHLLSAGERSAGLSLLNQGALQYVLGDLRLMRESVPFLEDAVALLRADQAPDEQVFYPLAMLALGGYFVDLRLALSYGQDALDCLARVLKLALAEKLKPQLGARDALLAALGQADASLRAFDVFGVTLKDAVRLMLGAGSALCASCLVSLDPAGAARYAATMEPLAALGEDHVAGVMHAVAHALAVNMQERPAESVKRLRALIARLERTDEPIRDMPEHSRMHQLRGLCSTLGFAAVPLESDETLRLAERLDKDSPTYAVSADNMRASWYAARGDMARCQHYRQRMEMHAIQLGTAWQIESWAPANDIKNAMRLNDALLMKRAAQELKRLGATHAFAEDSERHARGAYMVLRGRYEEAVELLDHPEPPMFLLGWVSTRGNLARALNGLKQHQRALEVCEDALGRMAPDDLDFCTLNLNVSIEAAVAQASLGHSDAANARLCALLDRLTPTHGPLTLGLLHEAHARVALLGGDFEACKERLARARSHLDPLGISTLVEFLDGLSQRLAQAQHAVDPANKSAVQLAEADVHLMTRVELLLTHSGAGVMERARKGLQIALELTEAEDGFLLVQGSEEAIVVQPGIRVPEPELVRWLSERLHQTCVTDETAIIDPAETIELDLKQHEGLQYCMAPLWGRVGMQDVVVGALALGFAHEVPRLPNSRVLAAIAEYLRVPAGPAR